MGFWTDGNSSEEDDAPDASRRFAAKAEEDELMDSIILNQPRRIREKELRNPSSVGHDWNKRDGFRIRAFALAMPEVLQIDGPLGARHTNYGCSCGVA